MKEDLSFKETKDLFNYKHFIVNHRVFSSLLF